MLKEEKYKWTKTKKNSEFVRHSDGWVYRKEVHECYYGGYIIHRVGIATLLGKEWISRAI